jgi:tetratricopeptide (TPR) repeat protein
MPTPLHRAARLLALVALTLPAVACIRRMPDAQPGDIPALRAQLEARPNDPELLTRLGIAQYKAGAFEESVATLAAVLESGEADGAAYLYTGLANEELENWAAARDAYARYIDTGRLDPVTDQLRGRLQLIVRRELQEQARQALAQEAQLSTQPPAVRSVAVFPFRLVSDNEELEPLQVALADMMITDLGMSGALTVLERTQIQSLLDEMALSDAGYTDAGNGNRAGRLLRAEHVVQGALTTLGDDAIRFDADVLNTRSGNAAGDITNEETIEQLFDLEKAVVFSVIDILGVELTPAEREAINQNRAESLLAFLAYGAGLQAMDRGDFDAATQLFNQSLQLDPGFQPAQTMGAQADQMTDASVSTTGDVAELAAAGGGAISAPPAAPPVQGPGVDLTTTLVSTDQAVNPTPTAGTIDLGTATTTTNGAPKQDREPVQESQGSEGVTKTNSAKIVIQIQRPGTE